MEKNLVAAAELGKDFELKAQVEVEMEQTLRMARIAPNPLAHLSSEWRPGSSENFCRPRLFRAR
jgi:hypothetical protein